MTRAALRPVVLSLFALSACGPMSVAPIAPDGASPDSAVSDGEAPTGCAVPRSLFGEAPRAIDQVVVARVARGFVVAAGMGTERVVLVRAFDNEFAPVGDELTIRSERTTGEFDWPVLSLRFEGSIGALGYDASVHELSVDDALRVSVVRSVTPAEGAERFSVLDARPRAFSGAPTRISAITRDGSVWTLFDSMLQRSARAQDIARFSDPVSFHYSDRSSAYLSIETRARRDINNVVEIRQFITGHGALLQAGAHAELGTNVSRVVPIGSELARLHFRRLESTPGGAQLRLQRHNATTGATIQSAQVAAEQGYVSSGAIGVSQVRPDPMQALFVWARSNPTSPNESVVYQWGLGVAPTSLGEVGGRPIVHGALVDDDGVRGWLVYASHTGGVGMPQARVFSRCVSR